MDNPIELATEGSGNLFKDIGFSSGVSEMLQRRAEEKARARHYSGRGIPLAYRGGWPTEYSLLCVEDCPKWYDFWLIRPKATSPEKAEYDEREVLSLMEETGHIWSDHVPTPEGFLTVAKSLGARYDFRSFELVVRRYETEIGSRYDDMIWRLSD